MKWCLDNSISSEVTTPVTAQDLASALISALESSTVSPAAATNDVTFDILLAEDNLVNQKLAVKILEKYGHSVEISENGSLAVDAFKARVQRNRPFDIILVSVPLSVFCSSCAFAESSMQMDVSMPFMGGMEATELIRAYEVHNNLAATPIIALTAHASTSSSCRCLFLDVCLLFSTLVLSLIVIGDRERCLDAGMVSSTVVVDILTVCAECRVVVQDDHITSGFHSFLLCDRILCALMLMRFAAEPLRRGDLLNSITKLAGERVKQRRNQHNFPQEFR